MSKTERSVEEIVEAIFKDSDKIIAVETKTETEFLHVTYPAHVSVSLCGNVVVYHDVPAKYATSTTVSEGAVDSREVTTTEKKYTQSDVVKMLLTQTLQAERKKREDAVDAERERIKKQYGNMNDGCGCCMDETLEDVLNREALTQPNNPK